MGEPVRTKNSRLDKTAGGQWPTNRNRWRLVDDQQVTVHVNDWYRRGKNRQFMSVESIRNVIVVP